MEILALLGALSPIAVLLLMGRGLRRATAVGKVLGIMAWVLISIAILATVGVLDLNPSRVIEVLGILWDMIKGAISLNVNRVLDGFKDLFMAP